MSNEVLIYITIISLVIGVIGIIVGLVPFLLKKGYPVGKALDNVQGIVDKADLLISAADKFMPNNPAVNVMEVISKWAKIAVGNAEQLYHTGEIEKNQRIDVANSVVYSVLSELKIEPNDNVKALIEAAIKEAVNSLGHESTAAASKDN